MSEPTPAPQDSGAEESSRSKRRVPTGLALVIMVISLLLAALIVSRIAKPLYALLFPQEVPVPAGVKVIEHTKPKKGDEYWVYRTAMSGDDVAKFYEKEGGTCQYTPRPVLAGQESVPEANPPGPYGIAQCAGTKSSGGLGVSWIVYIHAGYTAEEGPTIFRLYKIK